MTRWFPRPSPTSGEGGDVKSTRERVHFCPPWHVAHEKLGCTSPMVPNRIRPARAFTSSCARGARADRIVCTKALIASCRESRPLLAVVRRFVTPGGVFTCKPRRATDRLPRVSHVPLGVPGGPAVPP